MTTLWIPDSCLCEIEINSDLTFVSWHNKCELHKNIDDNAILNVVQTHNRNFNMRFPNPTKDEKKLMIQDKRTEKLRINGLGQGIRKL